MITEKPKLLIFDVNETLLDLAPLRIAIKEKLKSDSAFDIWFQTLLHYSLVETLTDSYQDFSEIAKATLKMVSFKLKVDLSESKIAAVLGKIKELPPHKDIPEALSALKASRFKLVAFSNGNKAVLNQQLQYAEIDHLFDAIISIEEIREYKPKATSYQYVVDKMETRATDSMMIAAHGWDIAGAKRAGLKTAFVAREGKTIYPLGENPDISGSTLLDIAQKLLEI